MRYIQTKLYSLAAPLALLPFMDMSVDQVPDYLRGDEFRTVIGEVIIQFITGIFDALIALIFGIFSGGVA